MKFIVSSTKLFSHLQKIIGVIPNNSTIPILDYFLFNIHKDRLTIHASDSEISMKTEVDIESEITNQSIAIPSKLLVETIKTLPQQPLIFNIQENSILEIKTTSGKYSLAYESGKEFPTSGSLEDVSTTTIPSNILAKAINYTLFATSNDDLRPTLMGVLFDISNDKISFISTDANKLVVYDHMNRDNEEANKFILPKKSLQLLKTSIPNDKEELIKVEYDNSSVLFSYGNTILQSRLIEGSYPNYESIIPKENPNILKIERDFFLNTLRRMNIYANKKDFQILLKIKGLELQLMAKDVDFNNQASETISCDYTGEDIYFSLNSKYLTEILSVMNSEMVTFKMSDHQRGILMYPEGENAEDGINENLTILIMPLRIDDEVLKSFDNIQV